MKLQSDVLFGLHNAFASGFPYLQIFKRQLIHLRMQISRLILHPTGEKSQEYQYLETAKTGRPEGGPFLIPVFTCFFETVNRNYE